MPDLIRISYIQRLCVNDGPGVRTVVFLKGCYLQCPWCCNPETIHYAVDEYFDKGKCKYPQENAICRTCERYNGSKLKEKCPFGAFQKTYSEYETDDMLKLLLRDEELYAEGGGITFSGGEPLLQAEVLLPLLQKLKERDIHIVFETTLFAPVKNYQMVKAYVDYWLVDLKFQYGYIPNTDYQVSIEQFEDNLRDLRQSKTKLIFRMVIMGEALSKKGLIRESLLRHGINEIELLACHSLAENKYKELHRSFHRFRTPTKEELSMLESYLMEKEIKSTSLSL